MQDFTRLEVWERAQQLAVDVYAVTEPLRGTHSVGMRSQLRRAASSIGANVAEGAGQDTATQFARYLQIAIGSCSEVESHLDLSRRVGILREYDVGSLTDETRRVRRMLAGLRRRVLSGARTPTTDNPNRPRNT